MCPTCRLPYTGPLRLALAQEWCRRTETLAQDDQQRMITKMIVQKMEKTMASRASTDHASLKILSADDGSAPPRKSVKESSLLAKRKR